MRTQDEVRPAQFAYEFNLDRLTQLQPVTQSLPVLPCCILTSVRIKNVNADSV